MLAATQKFLKVSALALALSGAVVAQANGAVAQESANQAEQNLPGQMQVAPVNTHALQGQRLKVAVTVAPPFVFFHKSLSEVSGIDIDILNELQKRTGFVFEGGHPHVMNRDEMLLDGENGKLDIIAGGLVLSKERAQTYDVSEPYLPTVLVLVSRNNTNIHSIADLAGRRLASENGSFASSAIDMHSEVNFEVKHCTSSFMTLYDVHSEIADATFIEKPVVDFYMNNWQGTNLSILEKVSDVEYLGFLFKKNPEISGPLKAAYHEMIADGTIKNIVSKYLNSRLASNDVMGRNLATDISVGTDLADNE